MKRVPCQVVVHSRRRVGTFTSRLFLPLNLFQTRLPFASSLPPRSKHARERAVPGRTKESKESHLSEEEEEEEQDDGAGDNGRAGMEKTLHVSTETRMKSAPSTPSTTSKFGRQPKKRGTKTKSAWERAEEPMFNSNTFIVHNRQLYCKCCSQEFPTTKHSTLRDHCESKSHKTSMEKYKAEAMKQQVMKLEFESMRKKVPLHHLQRRREVIEAFICEGIPLHALRIGSKLRAVLERDNYDLGSVADLAGSIPMVLKAEQRTIGMELTKGSGGKVLAAAGPAPAGAQEGTPMETTEVQRLMSVIFDGTTSVADVLCVVVRFATDDGFIQQRVLALHRYQKSFKTEELCAVIVLALDDPYHIARDNIIAFIADRASVNVAALGALTQTAFPFSSTIGCLSHTINNAGKKMENVTTARTFEFISKWINIIGRSPAARHMFEARTGKKPNRANLTRWYAEWDVVNQVGMLWGDVEEFLRNLHAAGIAPENVDVALSLLAAHKDEIRLHIAAIMDLGQPLYRACYNLEGDDCLAVKAFDVIAQLEQLQLPGSRLAFANTLAVAKSIANAIPGITLAQRDAAAAAHFESARAAVLPSAVDYLRERFESTTANGLKKAKELFESCRLCHPASINQIAVSELRALLMRFSHSVYGLTNPFYSKTPSIDLLIDEVPAYRAAATGIDEELDVMLFWRQHRLSLPHWSQLAFIVALFQPSSAAAERVFSMMEAQFDDTQSNALEDYRAASVMLRYNELQRERLDEMRRKV